MAREIAAIEDKKIKYPKTKINITKIKPNKILPLDLKTNYEINPGFSGIIISGITVKESPQWLKERLIKINQRPINNIVDITNYVMFELGNPIHAFDYDKIEGHVMNIKQAQGGEVFKSVDGISYHLPKEAVIITDKNNIIDLCGIKGGFNSGTFEGTKNIFIRVPIEYPNLIRRASQLLGLRSEASSIFERGVNAGGTLEALKRCADLVLELAGGEVASNIYNLMKSNFSPWKLKLRISRLNKILGITLKENVVINILGRLNLFPKKISKDIIETTIPTYRNDLKIEEDLIEEVARLYGYNNFPKTIPEGQIPTKEVPFFKNYKIDEKIKNILKASDFSEIYSYSLIGEKDLIDFEINPQKTLRVDNPVSREFEYLRPTLKINLIKALRQNISNFEEVNLFELGKVYLGKSIDERKEEYYLSGISSSKDFYQVKGLLEKIIEELGIKEDQTKNIQLVDDGIFFELNFSELLKKSSEQKVYRPIPKYPSIIEDLSIILSPETKTGEVIEFIKKQSSLITGISLLDTFERTRTFHIIYQHLEKNLTAQDVSIIREKIIKTLKEKFDAKIKE